MHRSSLSGLTAAIKETWHLRLTHKQLHEKKIRAEQRKMN